MEKYGPSMSDHVICCQGTSYREKKLQHQNKPVERDKQNIKDVKAESTKTSQIIMSRKE